MNKKSEKPKYLRHFVKAFIPSMIAALLIGLVGTAGLYGIRCKTVFMSDNKLFSDTESAFHDADLTQMAREEIEEILARNTNVSEGDPVDRAFLLECRDNGERYDSAIGLYAYCQGQSYVCTEEARTDIQEKLDAIRRENPRSKERLEVRIRDIYIREESKVFQPGIVEFVYRSQIRVMAEYADSLDLSPDDPKGQIHQKLWSLSNDWLGSPEEGQALSYVQTLGEDTYNSRRLFPKSGEPMEILVSNLSLGNSDGSRWVLREVTYYHFWQDNHRILLGCYGMLLFLTCLTATVIAVFTTQHDRKIWEMEQYRRELTNILAHDLRSPLTAITGYAENLKNGVRKEKQSYYMDAILQNTAYMDKMISDVLELSVLERTQKLHTETVDLMQLFREAFVQYEPQLKEQAITLHIEGECKIQADARMMAQAAANLVSNAVRYTPDGGEITVTGEHTCLQIANTCRESVDAKALAEPFAKSDKARSDHTGSGLGLTIVRQIMELHGACFDLQAQNSRFTAAIRFVRK